MPLITREFGDNPKGSKLSIQEMDENLIYLEEIALEGGGTQSSGSLAIGDSIIGGTQNGVLYLDNDSNLNQDIDFTRIPSGDTKIISYTYALYESDIINVYMIADNPGDTQISFVSDGSDMDTQVAAWNGANPDNTITVIDGGSETITSGENIVFRYGGAVGYVSGEIFPGFNGTGIVKTSSDSFILMGIPDSEDVVYISAFNGGLTMSGGVICRNDMSEIRVEDDNGSSSVRVDPGYVTLSAGQNGSVISIDDLNQLTEITSQFISLPSIPSFDDDTAAGVGGLATGRIYQTTGSASSPLNVAGILMIKQ